MAQKLPISAIQKENEKFKEITSVEFHENGKTFSIKLQPFFESIRVNKVIEKFNEDLKRVNESKIKLESNLIPTYLLFLLVVEFSDFPHTKSKNIEKQIAYFYQVIETHYFAEVADMVLPEEFDKVWQKVLQLLATNQAINKALEKVTDKMYDSSNYLEAPEKAKKIPEA